MNAILLYSDIWRKIDRLFSIQNLILWYRDKVNGAGQNLSPTLQKSKAHFLIRKEEFHKLLRDTICGLGELIICESFWIKDLKRLVSKSKRIPPEICGKTWSIDTCCGFYWR